MQVVEGISRFRQLRRRLIGTVGLVPTMGYLHEGHISLVERARSENATVVVSIFVNPTQFAPSEDYRQYPRDTERDLAMLEPLTDIVFMPSAEEMYPAGFDTWVDVADITRPLEGASRPGHFRGVTTVVAKLFNIVQPTRAYFGQKDAQQATVIRKMVDDLNMNLEVVVLPTRREPSGLAMSSRNTYLSENERRQAAVLYRSLVLAQELYARGERDADSIRRRMTDLIGKEPLADIDYVSIADAASLQELSTVTAPALVSLAVRFGRTRLIDNIILE